MTKRLATVLLVALALAGCSQTMNKLTNADTWRTWAGLPTRAEAAHNQACLTQSQGRIAQMSSTDATVLNTTCPDTPPLQYPQRLDGKGPIPAQ